MVTPIPKSGALKQLIVKTSGSSGLAPIDIMPDNIIVSKATNCKVNLIALVGMRSVSAITMNGRLEAALKPRVPRSRLCKSMTRIL